MKTFYGEFAAHTLRCWARGRSPQDEAGVLAMQGCIRAVKDLPPEEQRMLRILYASRAPFSATVRKYCTDYGVSEGYVWDRVRNVERRVAKERGLI